MSGTLSRPLPRPVDELPTIAVGTGQTVQIHGRGRLLAAAIRDGRGWTVNTGSERHQVATLDEALTALGLLPDHHRTGR